MKARLVIILLALSILTGCIVIPPPVATSVYRSEIGGYIQLPRNNHPIPKGGCPGRRGVFDRDHFSPRAPHCPYYFLN